MSAFLQALLKEAVWREEEHPRQPAGSPAGGEFASSALRGPQDINVVSYEYKRPGTRQLHKLNVIFNPTKEELIRWAGRDIQGVRWVKWAGNTVFWEDWAAIHGQVLNGLVKMGAAKKSDFSQERGFVQGENPVKRVVSEEINSYFHLFPVKKSWLQLIKDAADWQEEDHPRGVTTPESNSGSFAPADNKQLDMVGHTEAEAKQLATHAARVSAQQAYKDAANAEADPKQLAKLALAVAKLEALDKIKEIEAGTVTSEGKDEPLLMITPEMLKDPTLAPMAEAYIIASMRDRMLEEQGIELAEVVRQDLAFGDLKLQSTNPDWAAALDDYIGSGYSKINGHFRGESGDSNPDHDSAEWQIAYENYMESHEDEAMDAARDTYLEAGADSIDEQVSSALADDSDLQDLKTQLEAAEITQEEYDKKLTATTDSLRESAESDYLSEFESSSEYEDAMNQLKEDATTVADEEWESEGWGQSDVEEKADNIKALIDSRPPTPLTLILKRGVSSGRSLNWDTLSTGDTIDLEGFTSTSSKSEVAEKWSGGNKTIEIVVPAGAKDVLFTTNDREGEVILNHGSRFTVLSRSEEHLLVYYHPEGNEPPESEVEKAEGRRYRMNFGRMGTEPTIVGEDHGTGSGGHAVTDRSVGVAVLPQDAAPRVKKSWLQVLKDAVWREEEHLRGESVPGTNKGSFTQMAEALHTAVAHTLMGRLKAAGGFTYQPYTLDAPTEGYALSIVRDKEKIFRSGVTEADVDRYARDNSDLFTANPHAHFGGWLDQETGNIYLDISIIEPTLDKAIAMAQAHGQEGIYDLKEGRTIIVKRPEERRKSEAGAGRVPEERDAKGDRGAPEQAARTGWLQEVLKGDYPGHPFRGNQYTGGRGHNAQQRGWLKEMEVEQRKAEAAGAIPRGVRYDTKLDAPEVSDEDANSLMEMYARYERNLAKDQGWKYGGAHDFTLGEGSVMLSPERPPAIDLMTPKECFSNSTSMVMGSGTHRYCEGYVMLPNLPMPIHHAWVWDETTSTLMDPTLGWQPKAKYFGTKFSTPYLYKAMMKNKYYGLLVQGDNKRSLLTTGQDPEYQYRAS